MNAFRSRPLRRSLSLPLLFAAWMMVSMPPVAAEAVQDREGAVRKDRDVMEKDRRWIYNDWQRGFEEARRLGKPLMVVMRCVPCLACAGIDAQVLMQDSEVSALLDRFVCVRVINANALDLALFQFDVDLSFSTLFFNGDGTLYGRYGSWVHQKDSKDRTTVGYRRALEGALELHRGYPGNRELLSGKQGAAPVFRTPVDIPGIAGKYGRELDWSGKVVPSCVHCHQIGDAIRSAHRGRSERIPEEWVYPWPGAETLGLGLAQDGAARVATVEPGSAAAKAGLLAGDEVVRAAGQPLISMADFSWVLHRAGTRAEVPLVVRRDGREQERVLRLEDGWRRKSDIARRVGTWGMRAMALGGLFVEDVGDEERARLGVARGAMALRVKHAGEYGVHAAAKKAGFRKDDIVVEVDGIQRRISESELIGDLLERHRPGEKVGAAVLRGGERLALTLPMQ